LEPNEECQDEIEINRSSGYPASKSDVLCYLLRARPWVFGEIGGGFLRAGGWVDYIAISDRDIAPKEIANLHESLGLSVEYFQSEGAR
jgi:hypothetical protein